MASVSPRTVVQQMREDSSSTAAALDGQPPAPPPVPPTIVPASIDLSPPASSIKASTPPQPAHSQPPLELLRNSNIELNTLPREYLETYPYPAFVLITGVPPTADSGDPRAIDDVLRLPWTQTEMPKQRPFTPVWSNRKWRRLARGRGVDDLLPLDSMKRFGAWLLNANDHGSYIEEVPPAEEPQATTGLAIDMGNGRFELPEVDDADDEPAAPRPQPTITVQFSFPSKPVTYELVKSSMPIYHRHATGRTMMATHTFAIITSIPRHDGSTRRCASSMNVMTPTTPLSALQTPTMGSLSESKPMRKTVLDSTIPDEPVNLLAPMSPDMILRQAKAFENTEWVPKSVLHFLRNGVVHHLPPEPTECAPDGRPLAVRALYDWIDWSKSALGPREQWSNTLKCMVTWLQGYPLAASVWWGKDALTLFYNQRWADTVEQNHPEAFGLSGNKSWTEMWSALGPLTEVVLEGTPIFREDDFILRKRRKDGKSRETYRNTLWIPLKDDDGSIGGFFHSMFVSTHNVLSQRRTTLIKMMSERTASGRTVDEFHRGILQTLEDSPRDAPFAMLYHVERHGNAGRFVHRRPSASSRQGETHVRLRYAGGVGVPDNHPSVPESVDLPIPLGDPPDIMITEAFSDPNLKVNDHSAPSMKPSKSQHAYRPEKNGEGETKIPQWPFMDVLQSGRQVLVEDCTELIKGFQVRVWDELPSSAIIIPIASSSDRELAASVLILGISCRLDFDDDYEAFIHLLAFQLSMHLRAMHSIEADQNRIKELGILDRTKSMLFSNVSHELFTPLNLIAGPLDDVLVDMPKGPAHDALVMVRRNVHSLTRLVSMLMDVSNLEAGRFKGSFREVNLGMVTRDVAGFFRKSAEAAKLDFDVNCDVTPHSVFVDRERWDKILFNLIGNAISYTAKGYVRISLQYTTREAILTVKDSGVGLSNAFGDNAGHDHGASGIALSFTGKLVELHGGTIEIMICTPKESADGIHGTTIVVRLPLGRAHLSAEAIDFSDPSPKPEDIDVADQFKQWGDWDVPTDPNEVVGFSPQQPAVGDAARKKVKGIDPKTLWFTADDVIMIVDNVQDMRRYLRSVLEPFCKVVEVEDGQMALEIFDTVKPDLIIADVMMPRLNGFGLLNALRSGTREQEMVPFIMITAADDVRPVDALGADDYLSKPFNARELVARAHMQLQLGKKRRALETLFDQRSAELRLLTDLSPVGIFRCTHDGYVSYANQAWYETSGYPMNTPVLNWGDYVIEEHQQRIRGVWANFVPSNEGTTGAEWQWTNGRWVSTKVVRLENDEAFSPESNRGFIGCTVDITERKLNEELQRQRVIEAEQRRAEAEEAKHRQELLIDITSHEIRNPISSLMQMSNLHCSSLVKSNLIVFQEQLTRSLEGGTPFLPTGQLLSTISEDIEALDSIYQCGLTQERISNDVLSLGKIQLDMLQMFDVPTDIAKEAQKIVSMFQNEARMMRIALALNISPSFETLGISTIMTDPVRLGQIITNLLSNAIRFTATSQVRRIELSLDIGLEPPDKDTCAKPISAMSPSVLSEEMPVYLFVVVSDTGPGLTEAEREMLFQRFSQASPQTHTVFGGSGLGLFVCRQLAELMGGRIEVTSQHGKGSQFRFFIAAKPCWKPPSRSGSATGKDTPDLRGHFMLLKPRVLIVEDNLINRTVLIRQLRHVGLEVDSASNGLEAIELIRQAMTVNDGADADPEASSKPRPYDCVLMDLEMPVMDGYTAARMTRQEEAQGLLRHSNIIALTGNARQAQIGSAMADFSDVVVKPYRLDDLLRKIEDLTKASKQGDGGGGGGGDANGSAPSRPERPRLRKRSLFGRAKA